MKKIPLTQNEFALIDDEDFELVSKYKWRVYKRKNWTSYAITNKKLNGKKTTIKMHQLIMKFPRTDHKNGNGLDNQRSNLRPASLAENSQNRGLNKNNTSGFKGVHFRKDVRKWRACIDSDKKRYYLGYFNTIKEAAIAYDVAAIKLHGVFAKLNFEK
jgi:hypothetical protein